jgi:hypothetical protein
MPSIAATTDVLMTHYVQDERRMAHQGAKTAARQLFAISRLTLTICGFSIHYPRLLSRISM